MYMYIAFSKEKLKCIFFLKKVSSKPKPEKQKKVLPLQKIFKINVHMKVGKLHIIIFCRL